MIRPITELRIWPSWFRKICNEEAKRTPLVLESRVFSPDVTEQSATFGVPGSVVLSLMVEDVDQIYRRIQEEGWSPLSPCMDMKAPRGDPARLFCIRAQDGLEVFRAHKDEIGCVILDLTMPSADKPRHPVSVPFAALVQHARQNNGRRKERLYNLGGIGI